MRERWYPIIKTIKNALALAAVLAATIAAWYLWQNQQYSTAALLFLVMAAILAAWSKWSQREPKKPAALTPAQLAAGRPTLVEYYSDY